MKLQYTKDANADLLHIYKYIAKDSQASAIRVLTVIKVLVEHLPALPYMGKQTNKKDVYCIISGKYPYKIFYRLLLDKQEVHILHITHTSKV